MFRVVILVLRAMPLPRIKQMIMHMKLNFDSVTQAEISVTQAEISVSQAEGYGWPEPKFQFGLWPEPKFR